MNIYIYNKNPLRLEGIPIVSSFEQFKINPLEFYPTWNIENNIASETKFENPILDTDIIREKTREEQILLDNKLELLQDGEYLENNKIIIVPVPEELFIKKWVSPNWIEGATQKDIDSEVFKLLDEYTLLVEKKERWHSCGFSTLEIEEKMAQNILQRERLLKIK